MKQLAITFLSLFLFVNFSFATISEKEELTTLKSNYKKLLLFDGEQQLIDMLTKLQKEEIISDQMVVELTDRYPIAASEIRRLKEQMKADGSWSDIDYQSQERSGWKPKKHIERMLLLARVYHTPEHEYYHSEELTDMLSRALKFWTSAKLICPNWWYNEIGIPKTLGAAVLLFEDQLNEDELVSAIEVMENSKFGMTGQNKVWLAGNVLICALLENNYKLAKEAREIIFSEITIGTGNKEGIKSDWSYHQHGAQQQFGNYGAAYLASMGFWAKVFSGTSMQVNQQQLDLLSQLTDKGYRRILWKGYMDVNSLGRQFFKQAQHHKAFSVATSANILASIDAKNAGTYNALINENFLSSKKTNPRPELYHFWKSDQTVQRTAGWMASVKMSSTRVIGAERVNDDNKKGYYLADGAIYTYINGDEYLDINPNWNWQRIPGITAYQDEQILKEKKWKEAKNGSDFVGNVNNGTYGITAMELNRDALKARKSWIFTPNYVLCLGSGITSDSACQVATSVEQNLKKAGLYSLNKKKWEAVSGKMQSKEDIQRYYHNNMGYITMNGANVEASVETRTNSWNDIMNPYPKSEMQTKDVLSIWINHGSKPQQDSYQYLLLPNFTQKQVQKFDVKKKIKIIRNDNEQQIVYLTDEKIMFIASYLPVDMQLIDGTVFKTSGAGLFMLSYKNKKWNIVFSDPTQKLEKMTISIGKIVSYIELPKGEDKGISTRSLSQR